MPVERGKAIVERAGRGRVRRPEKRTTFPASQRLSTFVMVASTAAAGGMGVTREAKQETGGGRRAGRAIAPRHALQRLAKTGAEAFEIGAEAQDAENDNETGERRRPENK